MLHVWDSCCRAAVHIKLSGTFKSDFLSLSLSKFFVVEITVKEVDFSLV